MRIHSSWPWQLRGSGQVERLKIIERTARLAAFELERLRQRGRLMN